MAEEVPGFCSLCVSHCGCVNVVEGGELLEVKRFPEHPTGDRLCAKGRAGPELVDDGERVLRPLRRVTPKAEEPEWEPVSWDAALTEAADRLLEVGERLGPESVAFSVTTPSGSAVSDGLPWLFRLIHGFGSPNAVWTTHICNWHKDVATEFTHGADTGAPDLANAGTVLLWGFNPAENWAAMAHRVRRAVDRGAALVVVDPRRRGFARSADLWLRVEPGTDAALALGIANVTIREDLFDRGFVERWSDGPLLVRRDGRVLRERDLGGDGDRPVYWNQEAGEERPHTPGDPLPETAALQGERVIETRDGEERCRTCFDLYAERCAGYPPGRVEEIAGVPAEDVEGVARLLAEGPVAHYAWNGVAQSGNATGTSRAISTLHGLTGSVEARGGNVHFAAPPVNDVAGYDLMSDEQYRKALGRGERPLGPAGRGWATAPDVYRAVLEEEPYPVEALVSFGSNLLKTRPGVETGREALRELEFYLHTDLYLNPTAEYADIVLPVSSPWEREALRTGFWIDAEAASRVQLRPRAVEPRGEARSDTEIAFALAERLGLSDLFFDGDVEEGWRHVLEPLDLSLEELREEPGGVDLELDTRYRGYEDDGFDTGAGLLRLYSEELLRGGYDPLPGHAAPPPTTERYPLRLTCAKLPVFCNSQHRSLSSLRRAAKEPRVELHPETARHRDVEDGDGVVIETPTGAIRSFASLREDLDPGVAVSSWGWWQACPGLDLPGHGPEHNYNAAFPGGDGDPVSGSFPLREGVCDVAPDE